MPASYQPETASATVATVLDDRLPSGPTSMFLYAHSPQSWEFKGGEYLPRLKLIRYAPGVNGCKPGPSGHHPLLTVLRSRGWICIDDMSEIVRTGPTGELVHEDGYMRKYSGRKGPIYMDPWSSPVVIGAGAGATVDWQSERDVAGFDAWRRLLVADGTIPQPTAPVVAGIIHRKTRRAERGTASAHAGNPHLQQRSAVEFAELEAMREAAKATAAPKRRAAPRKKRGTAVSSQ